MSSSISIIIPTFDVADYIEPCIKSLQAQTFADFDVVIVNDGSTDDSADLARQTTAGDDRFTVIDQENRGPGPGGGRNGGLQHTRSNRLMFMDSDDALDPLALEQLVQAFDREPDLDMATTSAGRLLGGIVRPSHLHDVSHPRAEQSTTAGASPWLMFDSTPWNKVFRREFFDEVVGRWPEQQLYEDIAPMTAAILEAQAIAVLTERHYLWRVRGAGSITNAQTNIRGDLAQLDQLAVARSKVIRSNKDELLQWFDWKSITQDLLWMTRKLMAIPREGRAQLHSAIRVALQQVDPALVAATLPAVRRCHQAILDQPHNRSTRQVVQRRVSLLQDRRTPEQALASGFHHITLRRQKQDVDGVTFSVSSRTMDLRRAKLRVSASPPWAPFPPEHLATLPAQRSLRNIASFRINVSDVVPVSFDDQDIEQYYIEIVDHAGVSTEITRSIADAVRRRVFPTATASVGPLTVFVDDGRVRLAVGTPTPTIESARVLGDSLLNSGTHRSHADAADHFAAALTPTRPDERVDIPVTTTGNGRFCLELPSNALALLSTEPTWISLLSPANPAIATPFGVAASLRIDRGPSSQALRIESGLFGEAALMLESTSSSRARTLTNELRSYLPAVGRE